MKAVKFGAEPSDDERDTRRPLQEKAIYLKDSGFLAGLFAMGGRFKFQKFRNEN